MNAPLVSILIANYNNAQYIEESLLSVLSQSYRNIKIIIVDDNSDDNSIEIIESFISTHKDFPICFYKNSDHKGCGRIKRQCVELSHGEYFAFLDPDDIITPDAVQILMDKHQQGDFSVVYSTHYICDDQLNISHLSYYVGPIPQGESNLTSTKGHVSAFAMCSRKYYDRTTGINPEYIVAEDQDLYYKMEEMGRLCYVEQPLYFYRKHNHNMSLSADRELRNTYWNYECRKAAYVRRKSSKINIPNISFLQVYLLKCDYYYERIRYKRTNHQFWLPFMLLTLPMVVVSPRKCFQKVYQLF